MDTILIEPDTIDSFDGEYRFLSNFAPVDIEFDGLVYPSVEHAYQAAKTNDIRERKWIREQPTAGKAKLAGRSIRHVRSDWEYVKVGHMTRFVGQKFYQEPYRTLLINTGDRHIIEGNTWGDTFWGMFNGKGTNTLGKILMIIRSHLIMENENARQGES